MKVSKATAYAMHALMYMVRHRTHLPVTTNVIAKAEGVPHGYLAKIFQRLVQAGFVKAVRGRERGYVFAKQPEEISLRELFEFIEGGPLFDDCFLRHCKCGGTIDNCCIFAQWHSATKRVNRLLGETTLAAAAWNHPEHRFNSLPESLKPVKSKSQSKSSSRKITASQANL